MRFAEFKDDSRKNGNREDEFELVFEMASGAKAQSSRDLLGGVRNPALPLLIM
jgi:hypothetical protein